MKKDLQKKPQLLGGAIALVVLGFTAGCGGGGTAGDPAAELTEDQKNIEVVVGSVADLAGDVKRLRELFTKDSAPSATMAKKYSSRMFQIDCKPVKSGMREDFNYRSMSNCNPASNG